MLYWPLADFEVVSILFWSVVLIVLLAAAFLGVRALNKWMKDDDVGDIGAGFSLSDLRQMHKSGQMSAEEFEKAKAILLATAKKPSPGAKSTGPPPTGPGGQ